MTSEEIKSLSEVIPDVEEVGTHTFYAAKGCLKCDQTGYQGRTGVREVLEVNDEIRELIMVHANANQIKDVAVKKGMTTMLQDGLRKAAEGVTTIEEVLRIIHE